MSLRAVAVALALSGCGLREPGVQVEVWVQVRGTASTTSGATLREARLSVRAVELLECPGAASRLLRLLVPVAHAHGGDAPTGSPRVAAVDVALDLRSSHAVQLARLEPPPGAWCGLLLTVAPSGASAAWGGTTVLVDAELDGTTRRYLDASTTQVRWSLPRAALDVPGTLRLDVPLDARSALESVDPTSSDPRRDLGDRLLSSLSSPTWSTP